MEENKDLILIVEDEESIANIEKLYLEKAGFDVLTALDGQEALDLAQSENPDLIVLDLMLPEISGEEVLSTIRNSSNVPVIIVSAKSAEDDRIDGFRNGADDYMVKPFSAKELVERVKAVLRRSDSDNSKYNRTIVRSYNGDIEINYDEMRVTKKGQEIYFTKNEFLILYTLFSNPNKIFTRDEIIEVAFGLEYEAYDRAIDTHIKNIRQKLEDDPKNPQYIKTVYGVGYRAGGKDEAEN